MSRVLSLAFVVLLVSLAIAEADLFDTNHSNRMPLQTSWQDPLREWIRDLRIPLDGSSGLPANMTGDMPMGMGKFTVRGGLCTGLKVGSFNTVDLSSGQDLAFGLSVTGIGIHCEVEGYSDGPVQINISFADSSLNASILVHPFVSEFAEELPLPMGQLNITNCNAGLIASDMSWAGIGFLAEMLDMVGQEVEVATLVGEAINEPLCQGVKSFLEVNATAAAVGNADLVAQMLLQPPFIEEDPATAIPTLDWGEYPPIAVLQALIRERFTLFSEKVFQILDVADLNVPLPTPDGVRLALSKVNIEGHGSKRAPSLEVIAHDSSLGVEADMHNMKIRSYFDLDVALPDEPEFSERIEVVVGLEQVGIAWRAMVGNHALDDLRLDEALSSPQCLVKYSDGVTANQRQAVAIEDLQVEVQPLLEINPIGSPLASAGSELINTVVRALLNAYLPTVNALVNGVLGLTKGILDDLVWQELLSGPPCSRESAVFELGETGVLFLWSSFIILALIGLPVAVLAHLYLRTPAASPEASAPAAAERATNDVIAQAESKPMSLACEPCVPRALAVYYPFGVLSCMALFLYADLDVGTTVTMILEADGKSTQIGPLFTFSLLSTIVHAWSSGAYFISVLTVITSGIWPFAKLFMLLFCWLVPPRCWSLWRRGKILNALDAWGKYSFLDSWFLVITLSAFAINWQGLGSASLKIQTKPAPAFYAYFLATVLSLVLGHIASECHHRCAAKSPSSSSKAADIEVANATEESVPDAGGDRGALASLSSFAASPAERMVVLSVLITTVCLAILGTFLLSFSFEVSGIFTQFLFGQNVERSYSLLSVGMAVASHRYNETGLIGLEVVFVVLAILVPAFLLGTLISAWVVPMRVARQKSVLHACRLLDAWACLDVAALVLAIACFEFGRMAEWLVYEGNFATPCNLVKNITKEECMKIELHAFPALMALFFAGVFMVVVPKVCLRRFDRAIQRRSESAAKGRRSKVSESAGTNQI